MKLSLLYVASSRPAKADLIIYFDAYWHWAYFDINGGTTHQFDALII